MGGLVASFRRAVSDQRPCPDIKKEKEKILGKADGNTTETKNQR